MIRGALFKSSSSRFPASFRVILTLFSVLSLTSRFVISSGLASDFLKVAVGQKAVYRLDSKDAPTPNSVVEFELLFGAAVESESSRWIGLHARKQNGRDFMVWVLTSQPLPVGHKEAARTIRRYVVSFGAEESLEFMDHASGEAILPSLGGWEFLWPRPSDGSRLVGLDARSLSWLGHAYKFVSSSSDGLAQPSDPMRRLLLRSDLLIGLPSNSRTVEDTRRFDGSEYPMARMTKQDYQAMILAGINCVRVDAGQVEWVRNEPVFFWGIGGTEVEFPECLFRSNYLGPALFLDEPAVGTRDYDVRPRLAKDPELRRSITPQFMFNVFTNHFHKAVEQGGPSVFLKGIRARKDVDVGSMNFAQENLYSWETMIASAAWQLTAEPVGGPNAIVFEPPGRLGTRRTIPEMNMCYGCQLPPENPSSLTDLVCGFLRGAARVSEKNWGISIYGAVDPADAPLMLTRAYDQGATRFFFWDNYQLACVPFAECLSLSRHLRNHANRNPGRDLHVLRQAATTAILLPPGYDLGHVQMGRGNLWGLGELNLERKNSTGVRHRVVMGTCFTEIERCIRLGIPFDLLWDLPGLRLEGYGELVRVREDGRIELLAAGRKQVLKGPRTPPRPPGSPPRLEVVLAQSLPRANSTVTAHASIQEGSSPVYYTTGADRKGVQHNAAVLWELFGPLDEDYRQLVESGARLKTLRHGSRLEQDLTFSASRPGRYRLRAATTDKAGRSSVVWKEFDVAD